MATMISPEIAKVRRPIRIPSLSNPLAAAELHLASMKNILLALIVLSSSVRCASIAHGRYEKVPVRSTPSGAAVRVDCGDVPSDGGLTPAEVRVRRGAEHCAITLSKAGYADRTITFTRVVSRVTWGNVGPGLLAGTVAGAGVAVGSFMDPNANNDRANGAAVGGIVVGTGVGVVVDRSTGALYRQVPSSVDATLEARP
jgi:hypothetical protein